MGLRHICLWVTVVRHAETDFSSAHPRVLQGQTDAPLNGNGLQQAEALAWRLAKETFTHILSSDLARAKQTTEIISRYHDEVPVVYDKRLREKDLGDLAGKTWPEAKEILKKEGLSLDEHVSRTGETPQQFENRIVASYSDVIEQFLLHPNRLPYSQSEEHLADLVSASPNSANTPQISSGMPGSKPSASNGGGASARSAANASPAVLATPVGSDPPRMPGRRESFLSSPGSVAAMLLARVPEMVESSTPPQGRSNTSDARSVNAEVGGNTKTPPAVSFETGLEVERVSTSTSSSKSAPAAPAGTTAPNGGGGTSTYLNTPSINDADRSVTTGRKSISAGAGVPAAAAAAILSPVSDAYAAATNNRRTSASTALSQHEEKNEDNGPALPKLKQSHVLIVTHGGAIQELLTHLIAELGFGVTCPSPHAFPKITGVTRFVISRVNKIDGGAAAGGQRIVADYEWEGRVTLYNCVSHLAGFGKGGRGGWASSSSPKSGRKGRNESSISNSPKGGRTSQQQQQQPPRYQVQVPPSVQPKPPPSLSRPASGNTAQSRNTNSRPSAPSPPSTIRSAPSLPPIPADPASPRDNVPPRIDPASVPKRPLSKGATTPETPRTGTTTTPPATRIITKAEEVAVGTSASPTSPKSPKGFAIIGEAPMPVPKASKSKGRSLGW